jgi:hypothetical protein
MKGSLCPETRPFPLNLLDQLNPVISSWLVKFAYRIASQNLGSPLDCQFQIIFLQFMKNANCGVIPFWRLRGP